MKPSDFYISAIAVATNSTLNEVVCFLRTRNYHLPSLRDFCEKSRRFPRGPEKMEFEYPKKPKEFSVFLLPSKPEDVPDDQIERVIEDVRKRLIAYTMDRSTRISYHWVHPQDIWPEYELKPHHSPIELADIISSLSKIYAALLVRMTILKNLKAGVSSISPAEDNGPASYGHGGWG